MKYALILLAALTASSALAKAVEEAPLRVPGWLGLGYTYNVTNGSAGRIVWLFVRQIAPGGPADRAGLKIQDVIIGINGKSNSFGDELATLNFFNGIRSGERIKITIRRGRTVRTITVIADPLPPEMVKRRQLNADVARAQHRSH